MDAIGFMHYFDYAQSDSDKSLNFIVVLIENCEITFIDGNTIETNESRRLIINNSICLLLGHTELGGPVINFNC
jgi:hypothetical protein